MDKSKFRPILLRDEPEEIFLSFVSNGCALRDAWSKSSVR